MAPELRTVTLAQLGRIITGKTPPSTHPEYFGGDIPFVTPSDMDERRTINSTQRYLTEEGAESVRGSRIPAGAVMVSCIGSDMGKAAIAGRECVTNQQINSVIVETADSPMFVYYNLSRRKEEIRAAAGGSAQPILNKSAFGQFDILLPQPAEQRTIAHILGTLDDKIELNRKMNQTLEAMARAIFKSWFVDFDPVRAKAEGRPSTSSGQAIPGLPPDLAARFPDSFEDSELGEIPKGWEIRGLDQIATYLNGLALQKFPPNGDDFLPVIKIAQLRAGNVEGADRAGTNMPSQYIVEDGDVLFSWSGSLEVEMWCGGRGALNQHLFKVTSDYYPKWFYYLWTWHHLSNFQDIAADKATTMGHIQRRHLSEAKVLVPPKLFFKSMDKVMAPLLGRVIANRIESRTLAALRDALLPKLLSGEIRVKDAKRLAETTTVKSEVIDEILRKPGKRKATDEFREAILISALVRVLSTSEYPLGRKRYSKICYLVHRKLEHAVEQKYLKKAAGPYSPWTRYKGPESIAIKNGYIKQTQKGVLTGFKVGPQISEIDQYLQRYDFKDALDWAVKNFGKMTNDRLELLATVDFAVLELKSKGKQINSKAVRSLIEAEPEWVPKLNRNIFSEMNIQGALRALRGYFADAYNGISSHPPDD